MSSIDRARPINDSVPLDDARNKLTRIWYVGAGISFVWLMVVTIVGTFGDDTREVWSWFLPSVLPTLSLMIAVLGATAFGKKDKRYVRKPFVDLATGLSLVYLAALFVTVLAAHFRKPAIDLFLLSNVYLGPLQGLTVGAISYLFIAKEAAGKAPASLGVGAQTND
jgi:hypothetical protein